LHVVLSKLDYVSKTKLSIFRTEELGLRFLQYVIPKNVEGKAVPVTGLEWPRGFQEVKVPR
jgi:hypothetical protein